MSAGTQSYQLSDYLEKLPGTTFRKLYQQPSTAFAIYRCMLPQLARVFVNALLYAPDPFPQADFDLWTKKNAKPAKETALAKMRMYHMVQPPKAGDKTVQLSANFRNSMRLVLEGGGNHNSFGVPSELPVDPVYNTGYLDAYARRKWDDILHYVVHSVGSGASDHGNGGPKTSVKDLLLAGRLVERRFDTKSGLGITQAGFTFLLQEANAQVWTLLLLWLEAADHAKLTASAKGSAPGTESVDMLSFLFMLGSLELGRAYDTDALTESRRNMLPSLVDFGLIFIPKEEPRQYFPTRLATSLTSGSSALRSVSASFSAVLNNNAGDASSSLSGGDTGPGKGSIIIETNHRVYIYTNSPLQIAVLNLFIALDTRFQSMVTGRLTRESIKRAIRHGITAEQIISYLHAHAHEQMHRYSVTSGKPLLPPTVVDQIRLWQLESERMKTTAGFLFKDMVDVEEYRDLVQFAHDTGVLQWRSNEKRMFFASKTEGIRDFLKRRNRDKEDRK